MRRKMKQRLIAMICIIGMLCGICYVSGPDTVEASIDTITTLDGLMKAGFTPWTISDIGMEEEVQIKETINWSAPSEERNSLDKTIFTVKLLLPEGTGNDFGHFYIGGSPNAGDSLFGGFLIRGRDASSISFDFQNGDSIKPLKNFYASTAKTTLRGNKELEFSMSVEYLDESEGLVTVRIGFFFDGVLYNNEYYTYSGLPECFLTQNVKWRYGANSPMIKANSLVDITLENAKERNFTPWTFSNMGIADQTIQDNGLWNNFWRNETSLDKTIFVGKINFSEGRNNDFGIFMLGYASEHSASKYQGFRFGAEGIDKLRFGYQVGANSYFYNENGCTNSGAMNNQTTVVFDPAIAGTSLRSNPNLQVALSVEFISENTANNTVTMQVGVFFDGKLYDNRYFLFKDVPNAGLKQALQFNPYGTANVIGSDRIKDIMLEDTPENNFEEWTLSDTGFDDQGALTATFNWTRPAATVASLDRSLFNAKVYFPAGSGSDIGNFYIGGTPNTSKSVYSGFLIRGATSNAISLAFQNEEGEIINIVNLFSETAGVDLRGNRNLQFSMSTEILSSADGLATVKIGMFFDGKLYNNTYFEVKGLAEACLTRFVKWHSPNGAAIQSVRNNGITLQNAEQKEFNYWTLRDINCSDYTFTGSWNWATATNKTSLDKTIFNAKVNFSKEAGQFGSFYIGGDASGTDNSAWRGFVFMGDNATDTLTFGFHGAGGTFHDANGNTGSGSTARALAVFNPKTAGVALRGNSNLQVSLSVDVLDTKQVDGETLGTVKAGVFFDGKLYDNTYYIIGEVPLRYLTQNVRWSSSAVSNSLASWYKEKNVAQNATVLTSHKDVYSEYTGYGTSCLIDGVAEQNGPYYLGVSGADIQDEETILEFAFNDTYCVDHIKMYKKYGAGGFPTDFTVEAYTGAGWKTVAKKTGYASITGWNEITFADTECSAIRICVTKNGKEKTTEAYGLHIAEVEIWGVPTNANIKGPHQISEDAAALGFAVNVAAINDGIQEGNRGLRVLSNTQTENVKLQMMFDTAVTANGVQIFSQNAGRIPSDFTIYAFTGNGWEVVKSVAGYEPNTARTMHRFAFNSTVTCSSIMVVFTRLSEIYAGKGVYGLQLQEMCVDGMENEKGCTLLGDADGNDSLVGADDLAAFRETLATTVQPAEHFDLNMDNAKDCRDLVRMKRYFAVEETKVREYNIKAMSLNVLGYEYADGSYAPGATRLPYVAKYILEQQSDIVGVQEAGSLNSNWHDNLTELVCKDGTYMAVRIGDETEYQKYSGYAKGVVHENAGLITFYKKARFEYIESGAQAYTDASSSFQYRWFQWVKLKDKKTGEIVFVTNTHWSANLNISSQEDFAAGATYHAVQAEELLAFWKNTVGNNILIATGDYNADQNTEAIEKLQSDIYKEANSLLGDFSSLKNHIDYVFVNSQRTTVNNWYFTNVMFELDGKEYMLSDHYPVFAELSYKK